MLRKIIDTQQDPVLVLDLPKNLQGKRIEVIAFAIEEEVVAESKPANMSDFFGTLTPDSAAIVPKKPSDFFGTLSTEDGEKMHEHLTKSRNEWDSDF